MHAVTPWCLAAFSVVTFAGACGEDDPSKSEPDSSPDAQTDTAETPVDITETANTTDASDTSAADSAGILDTLDAGPDGIDDSTADTTADTSDAAAEDVADTADASDTSEWSGVFEVPALLAGARSDVPDAIMNKWPALLGGQMTRHTAITGIEFHIPGVISSVALSPTPVPFRRRVNGVEYWQVSGEISARIVDDHGVYFAVGPIDAHGVNHRAEPYDPFQPQRDPSDSASHPRAGLPGATFYIRWPVEGFNGAIIQMQTAGDGGFQQPQVILAWWPCDPLVLLARGYAVATVSAGSTVYARKEADGALTVDTNPESGSGIFFTEDALNPWAGVFETETHKQLSNLRAIIVDADWVESPIDAALETELTTISYDPEADTFAVGRYVETLGRDNYTFPAGFTAMEIISDAAVVFKNFMTQATGATEPWSVFLGWSSAGIASWNLLSGTQGAGYFNFDQALGMPPSGGNFRAWNDPSSGRRFDAFVMYGSDRPVPVWQDSSDAIANAAETHVDPDYPLGAPIVFLRGSGDSYRSPFGTFWANPTIIANAVARAWPTSKMNGEALEDYVHIYELDKLSHEQGDQFFTAWDLPPYDVDAMWYDPAKGDAPEALNQEGRGLRLADYYPRQHAFGPDDGYLSLSEVGNIWSAPRMAPLYLRLFEGLRALSENGTKMPVSRVGPLFASDTAVDATTPFPTYPVPCELGPEAAWEDFQACREGLTEDASWPVAPLVAHDIAAVHEFVNDNPLPRLAERIVVPDVGAPLGWYFMLFGAYNLRHDFTNEELVARYTDHAGWVAAFSDATQALVDADLWDAALGQLYIEQAEADTVLVMHDGECVAQPNPGCGAIDCCEEATGHQLVCCGANTIQASRYCTGPGSCPDGGSYPDCAEPVVCPAHSAPCEPGGKVCCNACGEVGPRGCAVCAATEYATVCDISWDGESCMLLTE